MDDSAIFFYYSFPVDGANCAGLHIGLRYSGNAFSLILDYVIEWENHFFGLKYLFKQKFCPTCLCKPLPQAASWLKNL